MSDGADEAVVLHVAPHPDDELIGAPATLMALRDAGHTILNLAVSLGREKQHERRREELVEASRRAGFELVVADPPIPVSSGDDLVAAERNIRSLVERTLDERDVRLIVSPWTHDRHHGHEVVARGVREALRNRTGTPAWWMWGLWAALPFPTLFVPFDEDRLNDIAYALDAHAGEVSRNDYRQLVAGRAEANAVLGAELVFGFGAASRGASYAELITEVFRRGNGWWLGPSRELDQDRVREGEIERRADSWIDGSSLT
jgi:LmbE family N-acetylglucosaminyl deacetylase